MTWFVIGIAFVLMPGLIAFKRNGFGPGAFERFLFNLSLQDMIRLQTAQKLGLLLILYAFFRALT
jgi:hypothetical protein